MLPFEKGEAFSPSYPGQGFKGKIPSEGLSSFL